jgi:hypothetical protein
VAVLVAFAAEASGGPTVRSGDDVLRLTIAARTQPGVKNGRAAQLRFVIDSRTKSGRQSRLHVKSITIKGPAGLQYNSRAFPSCRTSDFIRSTELSCPASTQIGTGTTTVDSRPQIPQLEQLPVTVFNASDDLDPSFHPRKKPVPGVLFSAGSVGFAVLTLPRAGTLLLEVPSHPPDPHVGRSRFVFVDVTLNARSRHGVAYVELPAQCPASGHWRFAAIERHYNGPTLTAIHDLPCGRR